MRRKKAEEAKRLKWQTKQEIVAKSQMHQEEIEEDTIEDAPEGYVTIDSRCLFKHTQRHSYNDLLWMDVATGHVSDLKLLILLIHKDTLTCRNDHAYQTTSGLII